MPHCNQQGWRTGLRSTKLWTLSPLGDESTANHVLTSFICALCRAICAAALFSTMASSFSALGAQERPGQACLGVWVPIELSSSPPPSSSSSALCVPEEKPRVDAR